MSQDAVPKYDNESDCREQVSKLDHLCRRQTLEPEPALPSLVATCVEFKRLTN